jgi:hypothetical protein
MRKLGPKTDMSRSKASQLYLSDRLISQIHCCLVAEPPDEANEGGAVQLRVRVEDFSRNGTYVNGQRVGTEPLPVKDGDIISLVVVPEMRADGSFHVEQTRYVCYVNGQHVGTEPHAR